MRNKMKSINGKVGKGTEIKDLAEIITGRKANKFSKYENREEYRATLFRMSHVELCDELMRIGETPSVESSTCRERCLNIFDRVQKPRTISYPKQSSKTLEEIVANSKVKPKLSD